MAINGISNSTAAGIIAQSLGAQSMQSYIPGSGSVDTSSIYGASLTRVAISTFGKQINEIYNKLKNIDGADDREAALEGMRKILVGLISNPNDATAMNFINTIGYVAENDASAFQAIFGDPETEGADEAAEPVEAPQATNWIDAYARINNSDLQDEFASAALDIIRDASGSGEGKQAAYETLTSKVGEILDSGFGDEQLADVADKFFSGLAEETGIAEKMAYIDQFDIQAAAAEPVQEGQTIEQPTGQFDPGAAYNNIMASSLSEQFSTAALDVILDQNGSSEQKNSAYNQMLATVNSLLEEDLTGDQLAEVGNQFFGGLAEQNTLEDKMTYMANFTYELPES